MFTIDKKAKNLSLALIAIGFISLIFGFVSNPHGAWPSLLFNTYFYLGIAVFAVFFVALQYVAEAGWSIVLKRVPEAIMGALPLFSLIMLFIMVAAIMHWNHIYHWLHEGIMDPENENYDKIIAGKESYLNATFFIIRTIIYLLGWNFFAKKLRALSLLEDKEGGTTLHFKGVSTSAWFMVFFAITSATASWDWIMSIDTHWFSTIFGWYVFSEWAAIGFTTILLFTLYLKRKGYLQDVNDSHIHDLGKWIFAFSLVWTYIWFSQFMLIWYSNIPEEVTYYTARLEVHNYKFLFWFSMIINFIFPLVLLMSRDAKRNNGILIIVSAIILIGHWLNAYLLVAPGTLNTHGHIGFTEIGMGLGFAGMLIYLTLSTLSKESMEAKNHPMLDESKHLHT
jgi:hypothetical protein